MERRQLGDNLLAHSILKGMFRVQNIFSGNSGVSSLVITGLTAGLDDLKLFPTWMILYFMLLKPFFTQHRHISVSMTFSIISKGFHSSTTALKCHLKMCCSDKCLNDTKSVKP